MLSEPYFPEKNHSSNYFFQNPSGECLQYLFPKIVSEFNSTLLRWGNGHVSIWNYLKEIA